MAKTCTWKACTKKLFAKGLCSGHYNRQRHNLPMDAPWTPGRRLAAGERAARVTVAKVTRPPRAPKAAPPPPVGHRRRTPGLLHRSPRLGLGRGCVARAGRARLRARLAGDVARVSSRPRRGVASTFHQLVDGAELHQVLAVRRGVGQGTHQAGPEGSPDVWTGAGAQARAATADGRARQPARHREEPSHGLHGVRRLRWRRHLHARLSRQEERGQSEDAAGPCRHQGRGAGRLA